MAGYIGSKAVNLSTTGADINGNATVDGDFTLSSTQPVINLVETDTSNQHRIIAADGSLYIQAADSDGTTDGDLHLTGYLSTDLNLLNIQAVTTAMNGALTVTGAVHASDVFITGPTPILTLTDDDIADEYTKIQNAGGDTYVDSRNGVANGAIILRGQGGGVTDEYARFDATGNFGIGDAAPSEALSVTGNIAATGDISADNLNLNTYSSGAASDRLALGVAVNGSVCFFLLPISGFTPPTGITVTGTFKITSVSGTTVTGGAGVTPTDGGGSSNKMQHIQVTGLTVTAGTNYYLRATDATSVIEVNY